jgi:hypothetical protein
MRVEILRSPGCTNAAAATRVVAECLAAAGIDVPIIERVGRYPSPSVLIDGIDIMRPDDTLPDGDVCRLDLPTAQRILDHLRRERTCLPN